MAKISSTEITGLIAALAAAGGLLTPAHKKKLGYALLAVAVGISCHMVWAQFQPEPRELPLPVTNAATAINGGVASAGQSGGMTVGTYNRTTVLPGADPKEIERKKKIRVELGKYVERLLSYEVAVRLGWSAEMKKRNHREDPSQEIFQYLQKNLDESYAERFVYPEIEDLSQKKYDTNPYIGQHESEVARAQIRYLRKVIDEFK